ncbi:Do family serine endopeptidase [Imtechella halotolerans]|uniref:Putative periplasmic serine protease do/hhoA-like protein n=1 Tax=Imtechella halotolerans K1 TaxID=946077 RepID=I0WFP0_9FLAO|nr:Do family serine endopeptidase [Imtechella halotolerans]EID75206.1 putative periplasmic serine protease do/hhoA-like protein [Imtechella halotolerans K1]WMQ63845.1 Do family serine endopeptidase [Imtechella halotolerans]
MKKHVSLIFAGVLGGAISLGAYSLLFQKNTYIIGDETKPSVVTTNFGNAPALNLNENQFVEAAEKTVHSVVHVKNVSVSREPATIFDFFYGSGGRERAQIGTGSGVIITPDGYIVTNNHVIANASQIEITLNNNKIYKAELVGTDPATDIALLKVDADEKLPYLTFADSDNTHIGEWVLAVGNPFNLTSTVTAGIISAKARDLSGSSDKTQSFIQTDAAVNPGNSGGALVNTNGDLIGINTAITSQTGSYVGYSFAVPSNIAKKVVEDIIEFGNVQKGVLGVRGSELNSLNAEKLGVKESEGFYVGGVDEGSGADKAGIKEGDIIKKLDNIKISKFSDLSGYIASKRPNDVIKVAIERDGKALTLPVTLYKNETYRINGLGLEVKNLSDADKKSFKTKNGVKITQASSFYTTNNIEMEGKVLVAINDREIKNVDDVKNIMDNLSQNNRNTLVLINKNGERERFIF